jgi:ABC-type branched-subunit amino acid transport system substrate-binding protein
MKSLIKWACATAWCVASWQGALAANEYDQGASNTEIKIGQTMPYSGPASAYGVQGKVQLAYFKMLNEQGGINGRKVNLVSLDDGYSPPKTLEQTRKLVEQDEVLAVVGSLGTPTNAAIQKYLTAKKIPHLLLATGASRWNDPKQFRWTTPGFPSYVAEARVYAKYVLQNFPNAKIGVLFQNDDSGRDFSDAFKAGLGPKASQIVKMLSYEVSDPTLDSQVIDLKSAGVDVLFTSGIPRSAALAIRKVADLNWKPLHIISSTASSPATLERAGFAISTGLISVQFLKAAGDPAWDNDPEMLAYLKFMKERAPDLNALDTSCIFGYLTAQMTAHILRKSGDNLTRENVLKQATTMTNQPFPMLLPGVTVTLKPDDYTTFDTLQLARFDGQRWIRFGAPIKVH